MPDSLGWKEGKTTEKKFKIPEELGAMQETRKGGKRKLLRACANRMASAHCPFG